MPNLICGICADGLCEDHERDCVGEALFAYLGGHCACPNRRGA
jgi:hypothetical protein